MKINKIYNEDNLETMAKMPDNFIDMTITSPPYDSLRKYEGYVFDYKKVLKELLRVTKIGGVVVWIVADQTINGSETGTSFKHALFAKYLGWNLHDTMIWIKDNPLPQTHKRYTDAFEYMFVFSKGKPKTFNPIMEKTITYGKSQKWSHRPHESKILKKNGAQHRKTKYLKIKKNVWNYSIGKASSKDRIAFEHPAIFPEKLVLDQLLSWSNENDLVYDPFMGSGTTAKVCLLTNRRFIGSEISKKYCEIAERRLIDIIEKDMFLKIQNHEKTFVL